MLSYCLKCRNKHRKVIKTKKWRTTLSWECAVCGSKKPRFIREQDAVRLLSMIGKIQTLGPLLIQWQVKTIVIMILL